MFFHRFNVKRTETLLRRELESFNTLALSSFTSILDIFEVALFSSAFNHKALSSFSFRERLAGTFEILTYLA